MYSVDFNFWSFVFCMGLFSTSIRSIEDAYFKMEVAVDDNCSEKVINRATEVIGFLINKTNSEIRRCNCTKKTNCEGRISTVVCLFTEADAKTIAHRGETTRILGGNFTNAAIGQKFSNESTYAYCSTFEYINRTSNLTDFTEFCRLQEIANNGTGNNTELCRLQAGNSEPQTGGGPGTGAIVGGTVGGLAGLAGAILAGWRIFRKLKKNQVDDTASTGDTTPITPGGIDFEEAPNSVPPAGV